MVWQSNILQLFSRLSARFRVLIFHHKKATYTHFISLCWSLKIEVKFHVFHAPADFRRYGKLSSLDGSREWKTKSAARHFINFPDIDSKHTWKSIHIFIARQISSSNFMQVKIASLMHTRCRWRLTECVHEKLKQHAIQAAAVEWENFQFLQHIHDDDKFIPNEIEIFSTLHLSTHWLACCCGQMSDANWRRL